MVDMKKLTSLCKRRGIIFQSSEVYGGVGSVWDKIEHVSWSNLRHDFGVALYLGPVSFHFPFWVSDPAAGESELKWRWMVNVGGELSLF